MSEPSPSGKRLLSIDGGGFRGLGCLLAIEAITNAAHLLCRKPGTPALRPCEIFDVISGSSTGGLLTILVGRLGLDCTTAIQEYKTLGQKLFGDDRNAFMDVVSNEKALLDPKAYEDAIADLVAKYGGDKNLPFVPGTAPAKITQTAVMTKSKAAAASKFALSWAAETWLVKDLIRQATAAPIYVSPFQIQKATGKPDLYEDAAYSGQINATELAIKEAKKFWKSDPGVIVSIGQWFSKIAVKGMDPNRAPADQVAQPFVPKLLNTYTAKSGTETTTTSVVKKVLQQAAKTVQVDTKLLQVQGYYRVDPPLGIGEWELVDRFSPDVEASVKAWLASPEGKTLIDEIAKKLVIPLPAEPPKPVDPHNEIPPPAKPGTHKPNPQCTEPRPSTMDAYLANYHVIFVIDDSTSMIYYGRRWEEARDALRPIADYALQYKADTIDMYFLNSPKVFTAVQTSAFIMQVFDQTRPPNPPPIQWTPTGACLQNILNAAIGQLDAVRGDEAAYQKIKPFDIILLTDGDPSDNPKPVLENAWARLQANNHHPNYVGVQIVQIGNDPQATAKLKDLMSGNIGSIVDTVPYDGVVTPEKLQRILLGALHPNVRAKLST